MGKQVAARFKWGCSSVGRAPALQAGGQEFESLHLHWTRKCSSLYLENRILKNQKSNIQIERSERRDKTSEDDRNVVDERSSKQQRYRDISVLYVKRKETLWRHKGKSEGSHEEVTRTLQRNARAMRKAKCLHNRLTNAASTQNKILRRDCNAMQSGLFNTRMVKHKERRVDALALRADERRDKLRKASGSCK